MQNDKKNELTENPVESISVPTAYVNQVRISHGLFDFQLLMANAAAVSESKDSEVTTMPIILIQMSPQHFKAFADVINVNLTKYEKLFGEISLPKPSSQEKK